MSLAPVLLIGATGTVGSKAARHLRQLHPNLPLVLAARNAERGNGLAAELGNAIFAHVDLTEPGLGLPEGQFSAVVALVKDNSLNPLRLAETQSAAYLSMADGSFELAPTVARHATRVDRTPILLASHWVAGMASLLARYYLRTFQSVGTIELSAIMDPNEPVGPMAADDVADLMQNSPRPQILHGGRWRWAGDGLAARHVRLGTGETIAVHGMSVLDTVSLAAATEAQGVRFDFGSHPTDLRDGRYAHDMIIEIEGKLDDGREGRMRVDLRSFQGVAGLTALGVALGVERALGLSGGSRLSPGLHFVDQVIDATYAMERFVELDGQMQGKQFKEIRNQL